MTPLQLLLVIIGLILLINTVIQLKKDAITIGQFFFWGLMSIALMVSTFVIGAIDQYSRFIGVGKISDLLIYVSIIGLFVYCYKLNMKQEQLNRSITKLVRSAALKDLTGKKTVKKKR